MVKYPKTYQRRRFLLIILSFSIYNFMFNFFYDLENTKTQTTSTHETNHMKPDWFISFVKQARGSEVKLPSQRTVRLYVKGSSNSNSRSTIKPKYQHVKRYVIEDAHKIFDDLSKCLGLEICLRHLHICNHQASSKIEEVKQSSSNHHRDLLSFMTRQHQQR